MLVFAAFTHRAGCPLTHVVGGRVRQRLKTSGVAAPEMQRTLHVSRCACEAKTTMSHHRAEDRLGTADLSRTHPRWLPFAVATLPLYNPRPAPTTTAAQTLPTETRACIAGARTLVLKLHPPHNPKPQLSHRLSARRAMRPGAASAQLLQHAAVPCHRSAPACPAQRLPPGPWRSCLHRQRSPQHTPLGEQSRPSVTFALQQDRADNSLAGARDTRSLFWSLCSAIVISSHELARAA